jgi:chemotaxis-related protein WspD
MTQANHNTVFDRPMPPGYRDELQALMAVEAPKPPRRTGSVLIFQLGPLKLALPTKVASAVSPVLHIARIPHRSGTVLLGLVAFRGEILPCCSLAKLLEVSRNETGAARMLVLEESPGRMWAVPIDAVLGIRSIPEENSAEPAPLAAQWISGSFDDRGGAFHLLDNENLFRQITLATA